MKQEKVVLEEIANSARRIIIRLAVGGFTSSGPKSNILTVESLVAFSTVVNELYREGYQMVSPEEYAAACGITLESVFERIRGAGELFLLEYGEGSSPNQAVPLEEKSVSEELGPHLI